MSRRRRFTLAALAFVVLAVLALLQVRWLAEASERWRDEAQSAATAGIARMALDLGELMRSVSSAPGEVDQRLVARGAEDSVPVPGHADVALDRGVLAGEVLPELAARAFGADVFDRYRIELRATNGAVARLYDSHPSLGGTARRPDASAPVAFDAPAWVGMFAAEDGGWQPLAPSPDIDQEWGHNEFTVAAPPVWRLEIRSLSGSLADVAHGVYMQNLLLSGGMLLLLVGALVLLVVAEGRARRLAEKELAFVASVSHELRTPLAVIRAAASNLSDGVVASPPQVASYGEMIVRETQRMGEQVERVLRFAGGGEGARAPRRRVDLRAVVADAVARCQPWRDRRTFSVEVDARAVAEVWGDADALVSALQNLLENAIKFGPEGQTIRVRVLDTEQQVVVEVEDEGPGIDASEREAVFEPFYRGAAAAGSAIAGTGLGLSVVADVARSHGGTVRIEDRGAGAVVVLRLPAGGAA